MKMNAGCGGGGRSADGEKEPGRSVFSWWGIKILGLD